MNGMFNSTTLDVIIGLLFVYLLLAIVCTTVNEWLAGLLGMRAKNLQSSIRQLLDQQPGAGDKDGNWFLNQFYKHPLITGMLKPGDQSHPAYLSARTFAAAVIDLVTPEVEGSLSFDQLQGGVMKLESGDVKKVLLALLQDARGDLTTAEKNIENWYDDTMDRASGWYKRKTQLIIAILAAVITILSNADTIRIVRSLQQGSIERSAVFEQAKARVEKQGGSANPLSADEKTTLGGLLGWSRADLYALRSMDGWKLAALFFGWSLTIIAVSLGAPFWFDVLSKVMNIRNAGKKPPAYGPGDPARAASDELPGTAGVVHLVLPQKVA